MAGDGAIMINVTTMAGDPIWVNSFVITLGGA
jgi:hypothetical protein